jgi:hypothetical protein
MTEWQELVDLLPTVELHEEMDTLSWVQERLENFSTTS